MIRLRRILAAPYSWMYGGFLWALGHLRKHHSEALANALITIIMLPFRSRRRLNLSQYWGSRPGLSESRLNSIEKSHLRYLSMLTVSFARLARVPLDDLKQDVEMEGEERVRTALKLGRGVLLVMDHFGNGWDSLLALSSRGYRITLLVNEMPLTVLDRHIQRLCRRLAVEVIRPGPDAFQKARKVLRRNGIFLLAFDATIASDNCRGIPFGRASLQVHLGTGVLALRSGATVLRISNTILPSGGSRTTVSGPVQIPATSAPREDSEALLRSWVHELQEKTTPAPEQWGLWSYVSLGPGQ
jgi:lauroyl/myristoyl acyltransferase